jgi:hypothetical protein
MKPAGQLPVDPGVHGERRTPASVPASSAKTNAALASGDPLGKGGGGPPAVPASPAAQAATATKTAATTA